MNKKIILAAIVFFIISTLSIFCFAEASNNTNTSNTVDLKGEITESLDKTRNTASNVTNGVVSGAGLPIKLAELTSQFGVFYYPIVSSGRALQILIKRGYEKYKEFMGGVVYEDPWFAGGHCGFSNTDEVSKPQSPYEKVVAFEKMLIYYI